MVQKSGCAKRNIRKMNKNIDFHSHVLPGIDDGSDGVQTSLQLLSRLADQGITTVCATSHYYRRRESIDSYIGRRAAALRQLAQAWQPGLPRLLPGAEAAFFPGIGEKENLDLLCLGDTRTLLVEMPFTSWPASVCEEVLHLALDREFRVVLAHPERYYPENQRALERLAQAGVGFQINADTLTHWSTRKTGLQLLQMTRFPALGSDSHNLTKRAPHIGQAREIVRKKLGEAFLAELDSSMNQLIRMPEMERI